MDVLTRLREPLVMSMFASREHLYQEGEAQREAAAGEIERLRAALEPFANYMHTDDGRMDLDNKSAPHPDQQGVGWVYLTYGDFRKARAALYPDENQQPK